MRLPPLESLLCLDAAARTLNFRAAARSVALSPAAFGQRIKQLEELVGAPLFERTTRSVQLTTAGLSVLPHARSCLTAAEECVRRAGERTLANVELLLGTRFELGMSWIVPELARLKRELAHITLHLYFGSGEDLLRRVRTRDIDCAVTSARLTDTAFASETLAEERYALVGAPKLLKKKPFLRPEHASRHTLLDIDTSVPLFRYLADLHGGVGRFRFAAHRWLGVGSAMRQLALEGEGVAVLPLHMVAEDLAARRLRRILPAAKLASDQFRLVFRRDDPRTDVFRALAEGLRAVPIR